MKRLAFFILTLTTINASAQQNYWQQEVHYKIDVKLNVADNSIKGVERLEYINHSPDTLTYIWFHLWPNAYKNSSTALYAQYKEGDKAGLSKFKKADKGYIDSLNFKINDQSIKGY